MLNRQSGMSLKLQGYEVQICESPVRGGSVVKNLPAKGGATGDAVLIFGSERSPGGGNGNPLQYFHLENPMDKRAWRATVHGIAKSQT